MAEPTQLVEDLIRRLGEGGSVDLASDPEAMGELLRAWTPVDFQLTPLSGSWARADEQGVELGLTAELTPLVEPDSDRDDDDPVSGVIQRYLHTGDAIARHENFTIPRGWNRRYRGRLVLRESAFVYEQLGIERVELSAVDVGRYVWAACGFDFISREELEMVVDAISEFAEELSLAQHHFENIEHAWEIAYMEPLREITVREVAEILGEYVDEEAGTQLVDEPGKLLLLHPNTPSWQGALDLRDIPDNFGREMLYEYTDISGRDSDIQDDF